MATAVKEAPKTEARYRMPKVQVGDPTVWYIEGDMTAKPTAAIVLEVYDGFVDLLIYSRSGTRRVETVHHVSDPRLTDENSQIKKYGGWDFAEHMKRLNAIEAFVNEMR